MGGKKSEYDNYVWTQRGGQGVRIPPEKSQKYLVSLQYWSGSLEKSQSYQASIQCWAIIGLPEKHYLIWAIIGPPFKWRFVGGPMMAHL